ncbi:MAG: flavin reductase family protein [Pseudomonadota bacterium]
MNFKIANDNAALNQALFQVTHGLYILTSMMGDKINGQCFDALMQITNMPPRIAIAIGTRSYTYEMISNSGVLVANVLDQADEKHMDKVKHFGMQSGRKVDKFADVAYELGALGAPILPDAHAFYECRVIPEMTVDLKTHSLYVCDVIRAGTKDAGEPFTYNQYRKIRFNEGGKK